MKPLLIAALAFLPLVGSGQEEQSLDFKELYEVIRTNLADLSEPELSAAAARGLIKELGSKVQLVRGAEQPPEAVPDVVSKRAVYQDNLGYIRVRGVDERLPSAFQAGIEHLVQSNKVEGIVIDLRYAGGSEFESAAAVADVLVKEGYKLLELADKTISSTGRKPEWDIPVVVLVNEETRGAAEALAGIIRESALGLIIGKQTAGEARLFETVTLNTGHKLRIGRIPVYVGERKAIPAGGIMPDIRVAISSEEERLFYQDPHRERAPFGNLSRTSEVASTGNRARRMNEAELVRRHRDGLTDPIDDPFAGERAPVVTDPALARALDFLKGITALTQQRRF